ncbi:GNAT family N-acetyltransferase [Paraflavitalea speifideaquila]|uniref:GNAT family N-acetyltransferase n=1 Tax=Paraflavitalea speifideaquila TaxID=3076558 RepID=UPI0028E6C81D|nr:GNAT family N-acetyltransferase [Paraflavitalea speifideiaquila]
MHDKDIVSVEKVSIREASEADIPALSKMAGKAFRDAYTGKMPEDDLLAYIGTAFSEAQLLIEWENKQYLFLLAFYGQELAGYAKISTKPRPERKEIDRYIELDRLYLLATYQGQRIGTLLMEHCIDYARAHDFPYLWLNVWEHNTEAIKFYYRWGFELVDWSIMMRGNDPQKALWMRKKIPTNMSR